MNELTAVCATIGAVPSFTPHTFLSIIFWPPIKFSAFVARRFAEVFQATVSLSKPLL